MEIKKIRISKKEDSKCITGIITLTISNNIIINSTNKLITNKDINRITIIILNNNNNYNSNPINNNKVVMEINSIIDNNLNNNNNITKIKI